MSHHSGAYQGDRESGDLAHRIEDYSQGAECTLFPSICDEDDLLTRWITAEEGAFVDLTEMR
ncbi:MAG: DUF7511 domain-containing protein [Halobacteriota archaeon]